jgi:hypothetical protein
MGRGLVHVWRLMLVGNGLVGVWCVLMLMLMLVLVLVLKGELMLLVLDRMRVLQLDGRRHVHALCRRRRGPHRGSGIARRRRVVSTARGIVPQGCKVRRHRLGRRSTVRTDADALQRLLAAHGPDTSCTGDITAE